MRLLLDTHAFIWSVIDETRLSATAFEALSNSDNEVLVSPVSAYEIEYKRRRDTELQRMPLDLNEALRAQGMTWLALRWQDARDAGRLPSAHRDPWDRLLVAQASRYGATLVTRDQMIVAYGVQTLW
jgi:PIN domain nuclease of toxin-antitoxin system